MDSRSLIQTVDWCICTGEGSNLSLNVLVLNYVCTFALVIFHFMKNKKSWFKKSLVESLFWQFNIYISHKTNKRSHFFVKWGNYFYQYNLGRLWHIEHIWSSLWGNTYLYFEFEVSFLSISLLFLPFLLFFFSLFTSCLEVLQSYSDVLGLSPEEGCQSKWQIAHWSLLSVTQSFCCPCLSCQTGWNFTLREL